MESTRADGDCPASGTRVAFCERPSFGVVWRHADGTFSPVRCGRSNSCAYCAWQAAAENMLVVGLDARERMPAHGITLTTRDPDFDQGRFRKAVSQWARWLRREVGPMEYLGLIEWTSGKGERSGGHKRMHQHTLVKGIPGDADLDQLWREQKKVWERLTGAWRVELRELRTPAGAIAYMVGHHHKAEQAPPPGWSGKRFRPSQGYFGRPVAQLREEAREQRAAHLRVRWLLEQLAEQDIDPDQLDAEIWEQLTAPGPAPELVRVSMVDGQLTVPGTGEVVELAGRGSEVEHSARDREDAGSIPAAPITLEAGLTHPPRGAGTGP